MSRRPRESESESEAEAEAEAPLRLDEPLAEEGLQDIDFDFDDPQERHAPSILGLLRKHPLADVAPRPALAALADLLAGDPRSVGTVVAGRRRRPDRLRRRCRPGRHDAARTRASTRRERASARAPGAGLVLVTHAFFVNTPPKVVAAAPVLRRGPRRRRVRCGRVAVPVRRRRGPGRGPAREEGARRRFVRELPRRRVRARVPRRTRPRRRGDAPGARPRPVRRRRRPRWGARGGNVVRQAKCTPRGQLSPLAQALGHASVVPTASEPPHPAAGTSAGIQ